MGLFTIKRTFADPGQSQSGMASPGAGAQRSGEPSYLADRDNCPRQTEPERPTKGIFSWLFGTPESRQRGFPAPENALQHRPPGSMTEVPPIFGGVYQQYTEPYSRGAAAYAPNFGKVLENPIGAGIVVLHRPQSSYGGSAEYHNGVAFWTNQTIPTSIHLQGLTTPEEMEALLGTVDVQAAVRVA
jgi:hypothetical protein